MKLEITRDSGRKRGREGRRYGVTDGKWMARGGGGKRVALHPPILSSVRERGSRNADPSVLFPHPISITTRYTEAMRFLGNVSSPDERVRGIHGVYA